MLCYSSLEYWKLICFHVVVFHLQMYYYVLRDLSVDFDLSSGKEFTHDFSACMYVFDEWEFRGWDIWRQDICTST